MLLFAPSDILKERAKKASSHARVTDTIHLTNTHVSQKAISSKKRQKKEKKRVTQKISTLSPPDLTQCDREPIHLSGAIQPHGVLLVLQEPELTIIQVSSNTQEIMGIAADTLLNQSLATLLTSEQIEYFHTYTRDKLLENNPLYIFTIQMNRSECLFDGIVHRIDTVLILELEPILEVRAGQRSFVELYRTLQQTFLHIRHTSTIESFAKIVVEQVSMLTGFDRVMIYRFEPDEHGVVIAEKKRSDLPSFLHLHYPASDIPQQARRLYTKNWLRLIADVDYQPVPLLPQINPVTQHTLDMTYSVLRSISPVHVEYLSNMGVKSSMSITIMHNETLWGLIACHHMAPKYVAYDIRTACEIFGRTMSLQLPLIEIQEQTMYLKRIKDMQIKLVASPSGNESILDSLTRHHPNMLDLVDASGAALCFDGRCYLLGKTPPEDVVWRIVAWIYAQGEQNMFETSSFSRLWPEATEWKESASGVLALLLAKTSQDALLWFRPEIINTIYWAGDVNKLVEITEQGIRLSPRLSFEKWKQTVLLCALPWQHGELEAIAEFRTTILRILLLKAEELVRLNHELKRSNDDLDTFAYLASHDLKEPLRGIHNYAYLLLQDYTGVLNEEGTDKLETIVSLTKRMENLINSLLHYARLGRLELTTAETDINEVVKQTIEMLQLSLAQRNVQIRLPDPFPTIACDQIMVGEIFANLIMNAIRYNDKAEKWIEIGCRQPVPDEVSEHPAIPVFYVSDNGIGIPKQHRETIFGIFKRLHTQEEFEGGTGAGLTIVRKIVERHGGTIWIESAEGKGTAFFFTLSH